MGDRASIIIKSKDMPNPIQLYGHWSGTENLRAVTDVFEWTDRIGDAGYLVAQLFHRFSEGYSGQLGFGIYGVFPDRLIYMGWEDNPTVFVDADTGECEVDGETYTKEQVRAGALLGKLVD